MDTFISVGAGIIALIFVLTCLAYSLSFILWKIHKFLLNKRVKKNTEMYGTMSEWIKTLTPKEIAELHYDNIGARFNGEKYLINQDLFFAMIHKDDNAKFKWHIEI